MGIFNPMTSLKAIRRISYDRFPPLLIQVPNTDITIACQTPDYVRILKHDLPFVTTNCHTMVSCLAISPDGQHLVVACVDGTIKYYQISHLEQALWSKRSHLVRVNMVAFSRDSQRFATISQDATIRIWPLEMVGVSQILIHLSGHGGMVALTHYGMEYIVASESNYIGVWGLDGIAKTQTATLATISAACYDVSSDKIAVACGLKIYIYQFHNHDVSMTCLCSLTSDVAIETLTFSPYGQCLMSTHGASLKIWNMQHFYLQLDLVLSDRMGIIQGYFLTKGRMAIMTSAGYGTIWHVQYPAYHWWKYLLQAHLWQKFHDNVMAWYQLHPDINLKEVIFVLIHMAKLKPTQCLIMMEILREIYWSYNSALLLEKTLELDNYQQQYLNLTLKMTETEILPQAGDPDLETIRFDRLHLKAKIDIHVQIISRLQKKISESHHWCCHGHHIETEIKLLLQIQAIISQRDFSLFSKTVWHYLSQQMHIMPYDIIRLRSVLVRIRQTGQLPGTDAAYLDALSPKTLHSILKAHPVMAQSPIPDILLQKGIGGDAVYGLDADIVDIDYTQLAIVLHEIQSIRTQVVQPYRTTTASAASLLPPVAICPLSLTVMQEAVCASDGYHYEKCHITKWMAVYDVSPMTNMLWAHCALEPNPWLQRLIQGLVTAQMRSLARMHLC